VSPKVPAAPDNAPLVQEPAIASTGPEPETPPAIPGYTFSNPPPVPMADPPAQPVAPELNKAHIPVPQVATAPAKSAIPYFGAVVAGIVAGVVAMLLLGGIAYVAYSHWKTDKSKVNSSNTEPVLVSPAQSSGQVAISTPAAPEAPAVPPSAPQNNSVPQASPVSQAAPAPVAPPPDQPAAPVADQATPPPIPQPAPSQNVPADQASGPMADAAPSSPATETPALASPTSDQPSGPISDVASTTPPKAPPSSPPQAQSTSTLMDAQPQAAPASQEPPSAESETSHASSFDPDEALQSCLVNSSFGAVLQADRFNSNYKDRTMTFEGTVARLNDQENLVVFHGGGVYPRNWDIQLARNHASFVRNKTYRVEFRLISIKAVPLGGFSFRGQVLDRTAE